MKPFSGSFLPLLLSMTIVSRPPPGGGGSGGGSSPPGGGSSPPGGGGAPPPQWASMRSRYSDHGQLGPGSMRFHGWILPCPTMWYWSRGIP